MIYRICKTVTIDNAHLLSKHQGNCRFIHGHTRTVEVVLEAERLNHNDMVCDFADLKTLIERFVNEWDHALCVNDRDPGYDQIKAQFGLRLVTIAGRDPTTEVLAEELFNSVAAALPELGRGIRLRRIRIWETPTSWAECEAES